MIEIEQRIKDMGYTDISDCGHKMPPNVISHEEYQKKYSEIVEDYNIVKAFINEVNAKINDPDHEIVFPVTRKKSLKYITKLYNDKKKTPRELLCLLFWDCNYIETFKLKSLTQYKCIDDIELYLAEAQSLALMRMDALVNKAAKS